MALPWPIEQIRNLIAGMIPATRTISTTAPLTGGGNLSANRTFAVNAAGAATATGNGTSGVVQLAATNNRTALNLAATPALVAAAMASIPVLGAASGRGQIVTIHTELSATFTIPSGGSWFLSYLRYNSLGAITVGLETQESIVAGGFVIPSAAAHKTKGFAIRLT